MSHIAFIKKFALLFVAGIAVAGGVAFLGKKDLSIRPRSTATPLERTPPPGSEPTWPLSARDSQGQVSIGSELDTYTNSLFGFSFEFPKNLELTEQYPQSIAPDPSLPYYIDLTPKGERYTDFSIEVLPKRAWDETQKAIWYHTGRYQYIFGPNEELPLRETTAFRYTGGLWPYLYYFAHPSLPYMFTFRSLEPPTSAQDWMLFYQILGSITFTQPQ